MRIVVALRSRETLKVLEIKRKKEIKIEQEVESIPLITNKKDELNEKIKKKDKLNEKRTTYYISLCHFLEL